MCGAHPTKWATHRVSFFATSCLRCLPLSTAHSFFVTLSFNQVYDTFFAYVEALVEADIKNQKWIQYLPLEVRTALEKSALSEALELTYKATRKYTPQVGAMACNVLQ
jgi:hypothetical protein